jgi:hypothetical protein
VREKRSMIEIVNERASKGRTPWCWWGLSLPWIGDVEWISFIEGGGRKELKHTWII